MTPSYTLLHLSLIADIGPATVQHIIATLGSSEELVNLYEYTSAQLHVRFGITQKRALLLANGLADTALLERELHHIEKYAISWTTIISGDYPRLLQTIHIPPTIIYWRGRHPATYTKTVALVGSRDAHHYGQAVIASLVPPLVQAGCIIISGGALGADSMAHRATIEAGGVTCVVLGSGLLHPYPVSNNALFTTIEKQGGTLLSIFPVDTRPLSYNFPARNRVIAGLSKGCVVIQAAQKSGARITAECALEQGRSVCAVPGPINDALSHGCHELIKQGALLVTNAKDILQELGYDEVHRENAAMVGNPESAQTTTREKSPIPVVVCPKQQIIQLCEKPTSIDALMLSTELSFAELNELLFDLQLAGKIQQSFSGLWCKRH